MGLATERKRVYLAIEKGGFTVNKGKENEGVYDYVDGSLVSMVVFDKPIPGYANKLTFRFVLADDDADYVVEVGANTTTTKMFAGYLHGITKGEHIRVQAAQNDRIEKVNSCFVESLFADGWHKLEYRSLKPLVGVDALRKALDIITAHPAYDQASAPKPKDRQQGSQADRENEFKRFLAIVSAMGMPGYAVGDNKLAYQEIARAILRLPDLELDNASEDQWAYLADYLHKKDKSTPETQWPKPLRDLPQEFDPFADSE